jgi:hypothetical protein
VHEKAHANFQAADSTRLAGCKSQAVQALRHQDTTYTSAPALEAQEEVSQR